MQKTYTFDKVTIQKILKGAKHSLMVSTLILVTETLFKLSGTVSISDPMMSAFYAIICQNLYNICKEYVSGV
jgi:hypothetical protein